MEAQISAGSVSRALLEVHRVEELERLDEEVAAAAGRIEERDLGDRLLRHGRAVGVADVVLPVLAQPESGCMPIQIAPSEFWTRNFTMYGSV